MMPFATPRFLQPTKTPGWTPGARVENDYYPTPDAAVRALLDVETFDGSIWEPACGRGHITRVAMDYGYHVISTDLYDRGFALFGVDFLSETASRGRNILTNPPFGSGLADRFVEHALELTARTGGKVAMLLDLSSLCSPTRTHWWLMHAPSRIYALDACECWDSELFGPKPWRVNTRRYCWAVWDPQNDEPTQFTWLSTRRKNPV